MKRQTRMLLQKKCNFCNKLQINEISIKGSDLMVIDKNVQQELIFSMIIECDGTGVMYKLYWSLCDYP